MPSANGNLCTELITTDIRAASMSPTPRRAYLGHAGAYLRPDCQLARWHVVFWAR